jgi:hypothetical protein
MCKSGAHLSAGDLTSCSSVEKGCLEPLLHHMAQLSALHQRFLTASNTTTASNNAAAQPAAVTAASYRLGLATGCGVGRSIVQRFQQQLRGGACVMWATMHLLYPHPTRQAKESLALYSGLTVTQVTDWFTNWRARAWKPFIQSLSEP